MTDSPGHLDLDALADVLAGVRDDDHLRACGPCTDRLAELGAADASVTAALGALPAPPLPAGLAERLAQALEQERDQAVVRPLRRRPPARLPTWLPAAAASVVLVLAGAAGWSLLDPSGTSSQDTASTAGGSGEDATATQPEADTGLALPRLGTGADWADEPARRPALARLLGTGDPASGTAAVPSDDGLDRLRDPAALAACLAALPGAGAEVLALDPARYAGAPAVAVVQPAEAGRVRVTVVGSGCSADDAQVLDEVRLPRP